MRNYMLMLFSILLLTMGKTATAQSIWLDSAATVDYLKNVVYYLAADSLQGRYTDNWTCDTAASFIAAEMKKAGAKQVKGLDGYYDIYNVKGHQVKNVMGILKGTDRQEELFIFSAHYDHIGVLEDWKPKTKRDAVYNGANDNASGVAIMLWLIKYFASQPHARTILFVAFSGEELGLLGSGALSDNVNAQQVMVQINLEMLGRRDVYKKPFITGHRYSDLRDLMNQTLYDSLHIANYFEKDATERMNMFLRSDNYPFAQKGIPAHSIMLSTDYDRYYHTLKDEAATLNYKMMMDIARHIAVATTPIINAQQTSTRINVNNLP
jgi:Zn-dependent M28 family amino/carboxypeptidase